MLRRSQSALGGLFLNGACATLLGNRVDFACKFHSRVAPRKFKPGVSLAIVAMSILVPFDNLAQGYCDSTSIVTWRIPEFRSTFTENSARFFPGSNRQDWEPEPDVVKRFRGNRSEVVIAALPEQQGDIRSFGEGQRFGACHGRDDPHEIFHSIIPRKFRELPRAVVGSPE